MDEGGDLRLSEILAALSYALDITEGQPDGHTVRTCLIGMRLADDVGVEVEDRAALFYALLLKDAGCSSNAAKISALFGTDDFVAKRNAKTVNHSYLPDALGYVLRSVSSKRDLVRVLRAGPKTAGQLIEIRCERGAEIARMLDMPEETAAAVRALDEHWDGKGHPDGLAGAEIPLLGRIICLAQTAEVFFTSFGPDAAVDVALERTGRWFDPQLVRVLASLREDGRFWASLGRDARSNVAALEPAERIVLADEARLDRVAEAFAKVIDAKSPYTYRHSERVAELAVSTGTVLGFSPAALRDLRHAALLHDIGKLGVSNLVLDKPGKLTDEELAAVRRHPEWTEQILRRVSRFDELASAAAAHHEKLDGTGYHRGLHGDVLGSTARILAVADIFEAMTAERPYRAAMPAEQALDLMRGDVGSKLCPDAFEALTTALAAQPERLAA
jgi:HD-GYP domain-containing protein (c-di-GMP phosphodiesterase class II)